MSGDAVKAERRLLAWLGPVALRWRLATAAVGGLLVGAASALAFRLNLATCLLLGWDALCGGFIGSALWAMYRRSPEQMRARAAQEDQGRGAILAVVLTAAAASIAAIALELSSARSEQGLQRAMRITLAFVTVAASWFMSQLIFALHYAHGYYDQDEAAGKDVGGLNFPGGADPDYWDFLHFAVIIGVAAQTADIAITAKRLRRLNTVHSLFAFAFNTVIVALTINLLAGLFS